jgi:putative acetyltransferase
MNFGLRPYGDSDWPALLALWVESWSVTRPEINFSAREPWLQELFERTVAEGGTIIVAEDDEGLLGFVLFDPKRAWLEQIALAPRAFGSGAAQALVSLAKAACPEKLGLDVNADNFRALAFYRSEGFVETTEGKNPLSSLPIVLLEWRPEAADGQAFSRRPCDFADPPRGKIEYPKATRQGPFGTPRALRSSFS